MRNVATCLLDQALSNLSDVRKTQEMSAEYYPNA